MSAPKGWKWGMLGDVAEINSSSLPENQNPEFKFGYLDLASIENGKFALPTSRIKFSESPSRARRLFERGDILMATVRPNLGGHGYVNFDSNGYVCSTGFAVLHPKQGVDGNFTFQTLFSPWFLKQYTWLTSGSSYPALNSSQVAELEMLVPPESEQRAISTLLNFSDKTVQNIEALLVAKNRRKQGLMQQLLTGKTRFEEFKGERWRTHRLGDLLQEVDRYVTFDDDHTYKLASIRRRSEGLFFREALQGKDIKTKVMKTIRTGDFLLSKMQVVHGAWGLVSPEFDGMFVSDSYISLVPQDGSALKIEFLNYLSQMRLLRHMAYICSHGVHIEKMTFNLDDFLHEKITMPPTLDEQAKIVGVLATCDQEIELLQKQLDALKEQKRGLMQKLLTGEIRVKTN